MGSGTSRRRQSATLNIRPGKQARRNRNLSAGGASLVATLIGTGAALAPAATITWTGGTTHTGTSWSLASNWNTNTVPAGGDDVSIPFVTALSPTNVTYDYTGPDVTLNNLTISRGNSFGPTYSSSLTIAGADNLTAANELVGDSSTGGTKGFGVINQSAGINTVPNTLVLGNQATDSGLYNLSGTGILTIFGSGNNVLTVGNLGSGTLNQSGGQEWDGNIIIAAGSGSGTYNLSGGSLNPNSEEIGNHAGVGTFTQTGGQNGDALSAEMRLIVGANGTYALSGDSSTLTSHDETIAGAFNQSAGTHVVGSSTSGSGYSMNVTSGTYTLSQTGVLEVNGPETIGVSGGGIGTFTQTGGQHRVSNDLILGSQTGSSGSFALSGGTLSVGNNETIGSSGTGAFSQSAGSNTVGAAFTIGAGSSYALSGSGVLTVAAQETITGTFTQTGGSNTANNPNNLQQFGINIGGTYHLDGGDLTSESVEAVSDGGLFVQTAGTHTIGSSGEHVFLALTGTNFGSGGVGGTYTLSNSGVLKVNGSLFVGGLDVNGDVGAGHASESNGPGVFNMQGGNLTTTDSIKIWDVAGNVFNFSGGTVTTPLLQGPSSRFNWTAGTLNYVDPAGLIIGPGQFFQSLALNPGMTINTQTLSITTGGTFTPNGGALSADGGIKLTGGTLSVPNGVSFDNTAQISGYGVITGAGNFTNFGAIDIPGGTLYFNSTGTISNAGLISLEPGSNLLAVNRLENTGTIELDGANHINNISNDAGGVIKGAGYTTGPLLNNAGATLQVTGTFNLGQPLDNAGTIDLLGPASTLSGQPLTNTGTLRGEGTIIDSVTNGAGGHILVDDGNVLLFSGINGNNAGQINLQGGTVHFAQSLINSSAGLITGHGYLYADSGLTNNGQIQLASQSTDVHGDFTGASASKVIISGGATATFYDPVTLASGSEFRVSTGSTAVFFGDVSGTSNFTGTGTKDFEAGTSSLVQLQTGGETAVQANASLSASTIRENSLAVSGHVTITPDGINSGASKVNALSVTGQLDLTDNKLIVSGGDAGTWNGSSYTGISKLVQSGRNGGQWNGDGIITTSLSGAADKLHSIGVATADQIGKVGQTFGGITLTSGDVLVMYTYGGDANLDGKINIDDYGLIDSHVGQSGTAFGWHNGDFNYDGKINIDDYGIIDSNIGAQGAPIPTMTTPQTPATAIEGVAAVPEPAGLCSIALAGAVLIRRRRRS
jgi:hypothetical protein